MNPVRRLPFLLFAVYLGVFAPMAGFAGAHPKSLADKDVPLAARQEKGRYLLHAWGAASPDIVPLLTLNDEGDLARLQGALDRLAAADKTSSGVALSTPDDYLAMQAAFRWGAVDGLSFGEDKLRHFFSINPAKYPCGARAVVWEMVVPAEYFRGLDDPKALEIKERLKKEDFARVSYDVTAKFGKAGPGFRGEVTEDKVGREVFQLYAQAWRAGGSAGPMKGPDGYYFVKVDKLAASADECFEYYRSRVAVDYGRLWLKKIVEDSITTARLELKPEVKEVTGQTTASDTAFVIGGKATTFGEARSRLPYLMGDERSAAFWKSIQRQALDLELLYESGIGRDVRQSEIYGRIRKSMVQIKADVAVVRTEMEAGISSDSLRLWYEKNRGRFTDIDKVSFELYQCRNTSGGLDCTRALEDFVKGSAGEKAAVVVPATIEHTQNARVKWDGLDRELQVAMQDLEPGEWSVVFPWKNRTGIVRLTEKSIKTRNLDENYDEILQEYRMMRAREKWDELLLGD